MVEFDSRKVSVFEALLPANVVAVEAVGYQNWESALMPEEEVYVQQCVLKRKKEFAAGRNCARRALLQFGFPPQSIGVGAGREPLFPIGISGSITHIGDYCAAAVVRSGEAVSIGIDAEMAEPLNGSVVPLVLLPDEQEALAAVSNHIRFTDTVVFSIKEAFFKAYYQQIGAYLDFLDAMVSLDPTHTAFEIKILNKQAAGGAGNQAFPGRFTYDSQRVYSAIALPALMRQ